MRHGCVIVHRTLSNQSALEVFWRLFSDIYPDAILENFLFGIKCKTFSSTVRRATTRYLVSVNHVCLFSVSIWRIRNA